METFGNLGCQPGLATIQLVRLVGCGLYSLSDMVSLTCGPAGTVKLNSSRLPA